MAMTRLALMLALALAAGHADAGTRPVPAVVVMRAGTVYPDPALAVYLDRIADRLAPRAGLSWQVVVLDAPEPNAFALPGGRILVTRGMLALANDEAEVAAVLAHEIAHTLAGDAAAGVAPGMAAELAADRTGLRLLAAAGYDPRAQADLQASLLAAHALDGRLRAGVLPVPARSYAPGLDERLRASRAAAAGLAPGERGRAAYLAEIDGIAWGPRPAGLHLRLHRIAPGEDVLSLASTMPVGNAPRARFDLLNGLAPGDSLKVGDIVKLVGP